jgi:hypothetical protein
MGTASGNIASGIAFDRCDTTYNADSTVATETLYCKGTAVGLLTYTYGTAATAGLQVKVELTSPKFSS